MKNALTVIALAIGMASTAASALTPAPLQAVPAMDITRYEGKWFEIARLPNSFQRDCMGSVTAQYEPLSNGMISVVNSCRKADGTIDHTSGVARADRADPAATAKLQVRFAPAWLSWVPFVWGQYWVVVLDPDYRYAVVSAPDRKYLWILSRTPIMEVATYDALLSRVAAMGFDTSQLIKTIQP